MRVGGWVKVRTSRAEPAWECAKTPRAPRRQGKTESGWFPTLFSYLLGVLALLASSMSRALSSGGRVFFGSTGSAFYPELSRRPVAWPRAYSTVRGRRPFLATGSCRSWPKTPTGLPPVRSIAEVRRRLPLDRPRPPRASRLPPRTEDDASLTVVRCLPGGRALKPPAAGRPSFLSFPLLAPPHPSPLTPSRRHRLRRGRGLVVPLRAVAQHRPQPHEQPPGRRH